MPGCYHGHSARCSDLLRGQLPWRPLLQHLRCHRVRRPALQAHARPGTSQQPANHPAAGAASSHSPHCSVCPPLAPVAVHRTSMSRRLSTIPSRCSQHNSRRPWRCSGACLRAVRDNDSQFSEYSGGLDPKLEMAVPVEQRPVNELGQLKQAVLYSWVSTCTDRPAHGTQPRQSKLWRNAELRDPARLTLPGPAGYARPAVLCASPGGDLGSGVLSHRRPHRLPDIRPCSRRKYMTWPVQLLSVGSKSGNTAHATQH